MKISAFVLTGCKACSGCLLVVLFCTAAPFAVAVVSGLHTVACGVWWVVWACQQKVIALVVEKSLSGRHNRRLDNVLGQ